MNAMLPSPLVSPTRSRYRIKTLTLLLTSGLLLLQSSPASSDLQDFYDSVSTFNNATGPGAYQGQTMNLYTGGSLYLRTPARSFNVASFSPPGFNAGCGGIDLWGGSFSFINKAQFVATMRNIAQNAVGYFFMLAIQSLSPDIANVQKYLQQVTNFMNKMNVDTCQEGKALAQGLAEKVLDKEKLASVWDTSARSVFSDFSDAWSSITATDANTSVNQRKADPAQAEQVSEGNLVWRSLKQSGVSLVLNNQESLEWIMSLTGTLVIRRDPSSGSSSWQTQWYPATNSLSDILGRTSATSVLECDTSPQDGCLFPSVVAATGMQSLRVIVKQYVDSIEAKMQSRTALTSQELAFIQTSPAPVYKIISVAASPGGVVANLLTDNNIDVIALAYAQNIITMALKDVSNSLATRQVKAGGIEEDQIERARDHIANLRTQVYQEAQNMKSDLNAIYGMSVQAQAVEKVMWGNMSDKLVSNIRFSSNLN